MAKCRQCKVDADTERCVSCRIRVAFKCPKCGERAPVRKVFECAGCKREGLCLGHQERDSGQCAECHLGTDPKSPTGYQEQDRNEFGYREYLCDKDQSKMVLIPAGEFPSGEDKEPRYVASYLLDLWPITNERYHAFVKATGQEPPEEWNDPDYRLPNQPVTGVSWEDAAAYAEWVGKRLPSEGEWEKAARGIPGRIYPWGKAEPDETRANFGHAIGRPSPVDEHLAGRSPYGCVDMSGNVLEWCADWFMEERGTRVLRGGSWVSGPNILRTTYRYGDTPTYRYPIFGFRCALSWPSP